MRQATPETVRITHAAPPPQTDPTCGIAIPPAPPPVPGTPPSADPVHRLVAIGDSITQGFQSFAIFNTGRSYPRMIADALGWKDFRYPQFPLMGGMPYNLELILHQLEAKFGSSLDGFLEKAGAVFELFQLHSQIESTWEQSWQLGINPNGPINHNLAVWSWDVRDALSGTAATCQAEIASNGRKYLPNDRTGWRTLATAKSAAAVAPGNPAGHLSPVDAATELGNNGGIETLIVAIGANNALGTVTTLETRWTQDQPNYATLAGKKAGNYNIWQPPHFEAEYRALAKKLRRINAKHVIVANVPHVTVAPVSHGVGERVHTGSRYYEYYTRPWFDDASFDPREDPHLTADEARAIDSAIDQYNDVIEREVVKARTAGLDWYHFDLCGMLDRLANRRYFEHPEARPTWWTPYPLPPALAKLQPPLTSKFFTSGPNGREAGGLFALDGVHPTTVGYGLVAQEFIRIMNLAGVKFYRADGTLRPGPVAIDFDELLKVDTLFSAPPTSIDGDLKLIGWVDSAIGGLYEAFGLRRHWG